MVGIYKITNLKNNLAYIGQSVELERRIRSHVRSWEKSEIDNAIKENGIENFKFEVLEECSKEELNEREIYWISYYNTYFKGYNNTPGGSYVYCPTKDSITLLSDDDIRLIRECYLSQQYKSGAEVQRKFFPHLDKHLIAEVYNGQLRLDIMPEVYQTNYKHTVLQTRQLGELNPQSIITLEDALKIRILYSQYERKQIIQWFPQYKERTIVSIISGQNWKHIPIYKKREKRWTFPEKWTQQEINNFNKRKEMILYEYKCK